MSHLVADNSVSPFFAIAWVFYPMVALVGIELFIRALNDDDDDDEGGGVMTPVYQGAGA